MDSVHPSDAERARSDHTQNAIYRISAAVTTTNDLGELFRSIHTIVGELMPADNFYIALYDPGAGLLHFEYFVDQFDPTPTPKPLGRGLTEYVLRTETPLLASPEVHEALVEAGEVETIGAPSIDWLGVPLRTQDRVIGVLVTQSYTPGIRFDEEQRHVLTFVSEQVAMAIERKRAQIALLKAHDDLELRVQQRTTELAEANRALQTEIAERRRVEAILREMQRRQRAILDNIPDMAWMKDHESRYIAVNDAFANACGLPADELAGKTDLDIWPADLARKYRADDAEVMRSGRRKQVEEPLATTDGGRLWIETIKTPIFGDQADIVGTTGIARDVTTRHQAEEALRRARADLELRVQERTAALAAINVELMREIQERRRAADELRQSEDRYRRLVETIPEAIYVHQDGRFLFMNQAGARLFGVASPEALIGHSTQPFTHPDFAGVAADRVQRVIAEGKSYSLQEEKLVRADGSVIDVEISAIPFVYQNEPAVQVVARDVTQRKHMEEDLLQVRKLESLGLLAGGIAHDFNNILTSILGNVSLVRRQAPANSEAHELLFRAERAALRARDLTQQLLTFSRGGAPIKKTASIAELLQDTSAFALRGSDVACEFDFAANLWPVEIDEGQISQVIQNLVINADQAMPDGGVIVIAAKNTVVGASEALPLPAGRYVAVSIRDQGVGIPEQYRSRIFDPYFTTKQKGSGLGLTTAYSIVKSHGGYITVESEIGVGTCFQICLPASEGAPERQVTSDQQPRIGSGRILFMDDDEVVRETAGRMLQGAGYQVEFASDGEQALETYYRARQIGQSFDLVIMDLTIPGGLGGKEAIRRLRTFYPDVKAIVSSGYSNDPVMGNYKQHGFDAVVAKPYAGEELLQAISSVLASPSNAP